MKKLLPLVAGITLLVGVSAVNASEPVLLTTDQMDQVTAGADQTNTITITTGGDVTIRDVNQSNDDD